MLSFVACGAAAMQQRSSLVDDSLLLTSRVHHIACIDQRFSTFGMHVVWH